ncbi:hypothetical protein CLIB1423_03S02674 [[Candida] railenensis]|uniref:Uncharacterized protein n=1 Tax=[Candida] railenensis TaxID=45579 RepID=A0A9P0QMI6_9ASCO|nr:hypothetical protein CLIB1423_03S02674 [[Candida] railenensis]
MKSFPALLRLSSGYFSKPPLNYETLNQRLTFALKNKVNVTPDHLTDFIKAGRKLELEKLNQNIYNSNIVTKDDFLGIRHKYSISDIESKIALFLKSNYSIVAQKDSIIKAYLLTEPKPTNPKMIIDLLKDSFKRDGGDIASKIGLLNVATKVLLYDKDYYNAFNLIDCTILSEEWIKRKWESIVYGNMLYLVGLTFLSSVMAWSYSVLIGALWFLCGTALKVGFSKINYSKQLPRLSWRPHVRVIHRCVRNDELFIVNKIITHFEEHSEVNVRNFHHSDVRIVPKLNMLQRNDYILELPTENATSEIEILFRNQLNKRRMVLNDLQEELMFLDYWLVQGEDYDWCEPDQDPAEIIKLETQKRT